MAGPKHKHRRTLKDTRSPVVMPDRTSTAHSTVPKAQDRGGRMGGRPAGAWGMAANLRYVPNMMNKTTARTWPGRDRAEARKQSRITTASQDQIRSGQAIALEI